MAHLILGLCIGDVAGESQRFLSLQQEVTRLERARGSSPDDIRAAREELTSAAAAFAPMRQKLGMHRLLGIAAALVALLVNCITVTYFIGTARWCQEVVDTYGFDPRLAESSRQLKRRSFPWSLGSVLFLLAILALGATADPIGLGGGETWAKTHMWVAMLGIVFLAWSFFVQLGNLAANTDVIQQIIAQVNQRQEAGGRDASTEHLASS